MNKFLKSSNSALTIIIIIGILVVLNFFSYQIFYRLDLTQNKDYSISETSKRTVGELDDVVNIKVYFSENLPSQYINLRQEVGDILDEYVNYSNNKIKVEFIDPKDDSETKRELYMLGVPELQFNVLEKDKYQVVNGYLSMVVGYEDKKEAIPVIENTANLEYDVTLAIKKATGKITAVVGFATGNGAANPDKEISVAYKELGKLYETREVDLTAEKSVPEDIDTLIIAGPKEKFSEDELKAIDAFLTSGGSLLILADGVKVGEGLRAESNDIGLDKLLENYGVQINHDLVLDVSSGIASFSQGFITFSTNYPFWPKVLKSGFDKDNVAVAKLESLVLPWASSLDILTDKMDKDGRVSYLAKTTKRAWRETSNFNLNPEGPREKGGEEQYNLAVSIFGKFASAYNQGNIGQGRLIMVGDSDFLRDNFIRQNPGNLLFFQNLVDSLSLDEDLINIRSKGVTERPIKELSESAKAAVRYGNIFGMTLVVVIFGMARYFIRRRV
ncbi:GldG family protein [Candidatus Falkowbacteria bacterium]|nr:GldG family protein [Candidatus Falkowbacteria bacterium]